jgi:hypothetical protein
MTETNYKKNILKISIFLSLFLIFGKIHASFYFSADLSYGSSSPDVTELQKALNQDQRTRVSDTGLGSPGFETSFFGAKTKEAVMRFQELYRTEVLTPGGFASPTGYVGARTRAKLNNILMPVPNEYQLPIPSISNEQNTSVKLEIASVSPINFNDGDKIEIAGNGFEFQNRISFDFSPDEEIVAKSTDGKNISANINTNMGASIRKTLAGIKENAQAYDLVFKSMQENFGSIGRDGVYVQTSLVVKNSKGASNKMPVVIKIADGK